MAVDRATLTSDFAGFLKPEQSQPIFEEARKVSLAQGLARRVPLGINGQEIPFTTTKPTAGWVAEAGKKPATSGGMSLATITPKKMAAIAVVSAETVRANPGGYMENLTADIGEAFALTFDLAAFYGVDTPFGAGNHLSATTKTVTLGTAAKTDGGLYSDVNAGLGLLLRDGKKMTGFAFDSVAEAVFNDAVDANGRPLFVDAPYEGSSLMSGRILRRPALLGEGLERDGVVGFGGDWSKAVWGTVGGISYDVSTQATVTLNGTLVSLWEHNLVAVRAEAEFGWLVHDVEAFVKYAETAEPAA
jgi:HK97 family phage major capsid protein